MGKNLYIIGGTMGAGKTTVCQVLKRKLERSVFLDGDWCWDSSPFVVNDETKAMVMDNICYLLNSFLSCSSYSNVIFCWVLHQQEIIDELLSRLHTDGCSVKVISLICSEQALRTRLLKDVSSGIRTPDIIDRSVLRIPLYEKLNTLKVDISEYTPEQAAERIARL